jgi:hypothetical protein
MTSTSATAKFFTTSNPCSNDNPTWDSATQLCPNSTANFEYLFDGAFTTTAATVTTTTTSDYSTEHTLPTSSNEGEFPSGYSCTDVSGPKEQEGGAEGNNDSEREAVYLAFDYEIYTPSNPTEDVINATLSEFEKKMVNGVARAVGLVDCPQKSLHGSVTGRMQHGSQKLRQRHYLRRSLQRKVLESTATAVVEVSMKPMDLIDSIFCEYQGGSFFGISAYSHPVAIPCPSFHSGMYFTGDTG